MPHAAKPGQAGGMPNDATPTASPRRRRQQAGCRTGMRGPSGRTSHEGGRMSTQRRRRLHAGPVGGARSRGDRPWTAHRSGPAGVRSSPQTSTRGVRNTGGRPGHPAAGAWTRTNRHSRGKKIHARSRVRQKTSTSRPHQTRHSVPAAAASSPPRSPQQKKPTPCAVNDVRGATSWVMASWNRRPPATTVVTPAGCRVPVRPPPTPPPAGVP